MSSARPFCLPRTPLAIVCAMTSGALYALGFCGFDQYPLAWVCLVPLLWVLDAQAASGRQGFLLGWLTGLTAHLGVYTWLIYMLRHFAFLPWGLSVLGYVLLCLAQALLFGAFGWLYVAGTQRLRAPGWLWAPVCMVLCEYLVPALFPSYLANSQYRALAVIQGCELWGVLGLTFLLVLCSSVVAQVLRRLTHGGPTPYLPVAILLLLGCGNWAFGVWRLRTLAADDDQKHLRVGLVQANMGIYDKRENPAEGLMRHRDQSAELEAQGAQLIIWPESGFYYGIAEDKREVKHEVLGPLHTPILFGGLKVSHRQGRVRFYNTAFLTAADGTIVGTYDKRFLLMFGEYLPLGEWLPLLYQLSPQTSHFSRGTGTQALHLGDQSYGCLICYEDILPSYVRQVVQSGANILVNLTNDAWFGNSHEPRIHLALAVFRAIEHRRYLVRATNTGISAIVEPSGRIVAHSPVMQRANVMGSVAPRHDTTLYTRAGDWVAYLCLGGALGLLAIRRARS